MKYNIDAEKKLLHILLKNPDFVIKFIESGCPDHYFSENAQIILQSILESNERGVKLTRAGLTKKLSKLSPARAARVESFYTDCLLISESKDNFYVLRAEIVERYLSDFVNDSYNNFLMDAKSLGLVPAFESLKGNLLDVDTETTLNAKEKIFYDNASVVAWEKIDYIKKVRSGEIQEEPRVLSGITEIDETMCTGFAPGTLSLVVADVGAFKSAIMLNIAINVWKQGHDVLFVPIEMENSQVMDRVLANLSGVSVGKFYRITDLTDEDMERIEEAARDMERGVGEESAKLYLLQIPYRTTVSGIRRQIESHIEDFQPKLVVVDYIDNLSPDTSYKDRHDREISDMLQTLRQMGKIKGFGILSGAQLGREALKRIRKTSNKDAAGVINSEDIRGAHTFSTDADYIWAQVPSVSQPTSLLEIYVVKARNGKKVFSDNKHKALLENQPDICTIRSSLNTNIIGLEQKLGILQGDPSAGDQINNFVDHAPDQNNFSNSFDFNDSFAGNDIVDDDIDF